MSIGSPQNSFSSSPYRDSFSYDEERTDNEVSSRDQSPTARKDATSPLIETILSRAASALDFFQTRIPKIPSSPFLRFSPKINKEEAYRNLAAQATENIGRYAKNSREGQWYKIQAEAYGEAATALTNLEKLRENPELVSLYNQLVQVALEIASICNTLVTVKQHDASAISLRAKEQSLYKALTSLKFACETFSESREASNAFNAAATEALRQQETLIPNYEAYENMHRSAMRMLPPLSL